MPLEYRGFFLWFASFADSARLSLRWETHVASPANIWIYHRFAMWPPYTDVYCFSGIEFLTLVAVFRMTRRELLHIHRTITHWRVSSVSLRGLGKSAVDEGTESRGCTIAARKITASFNPFLMMVGDTIDSSVVRMAVLQFALKDGELKEHECMMTSTKAHIRLSVDYRAAEDRRCQHSMLSHSNTNYHWT